MNRPPLKPKNKDRRTREYLTETEVGQLVDAAKKAGRHGHRDATMILVAFKHGLRVSELVLLRWEQVDLDQGLLHVHRLKRGTPSTHPLGGTEIRALRKIKRDDPASCFVFNSERKGPMTPSTFHRVVSRAGKLASLPFPAHPHMLRHATGFKLANDGQDTRAIQHYLGHKNIQHTVVYTTLTPERFRNFFPD